MNKYIDLEQNNCMADVIKGILLVFLAIILSACQGVRLDSSKKYSTTESVYQKPYRYIGMPVNDVANAFSTRVNKGGNLSFSDNKHSYLFESFNGIVSYVDVSFQEFSKCNQTEGFNSKPLLDALSVDSESLELARMQKHYHAYYDHKNKLKISVMCSYEGGNLSVGFSKKYYGK